ncbi:MAG: hypothetical protein IJ659_03065 [Alloprevotella sp.]|nr:hypothetical protein [Alloprevotella sp.]
MTNDEYIRKYGISKENYFKENFNEVNSLTAKCLRNISESWVYEEYPELEIGRTYHVSHIGVYKSSTRIILQEFGDKEYNYVCFELYENGELMNDWKITRDRRFWAPYLRERFEKGDK